MWKWTTIESMRKWTTIESNGILGDVKIINLGRSSIGSKGVVTGKGLLQFYEFQDTSSIWNYISQEQAVSQK